MELIKAQKLTYHNGNDSILQDADFRILQGNKYALIGPNGSGKTTLIRLLTGELAADSGTLRRSPGLRMGLVQQIPEYSSGQTLMDYLMEPYLPLQNRLRELEEKMASAPDEQQPVLLNSYQETLDSFEQQGGYSARENLEKIIDNLGLDSPLDQPMETLSGGEKSLVCFARALLKQPDLLILDEPGNHLDYLGLAWLESFLQNYSGAVLIVSHNRYLLERTCSTLWELEGGILTEYTGSYSSYKKEKYQKALIQQHEHTERLKTIKELESKIAELQSIAMSQYNPPAKIMKQLGAAKAKRERLKNLIQTTPLPSRQEIKIKLRESDGQSKTAIRVKDFCLKFGERVLFDHAGLEILHGEKVALTGANGTGKTSFVSRLAEEGDWEHPVLKLGPSLKMGYLSQIEQFNEPQGTVEQEVRSWGPLSRDDAFALISPFLFEYNEMEKPVAVLSGGEKNRLKLARLIYEAPDIMILDEPTNHMDIRSREIMEQALQDYKGTLLLVSHDRWFLDQLAMRVVDIQDGKLVSYPGNFSEFFALKYPVLPRLSGKIDSRRKERELSSPAPLTPTPSTRLEERIEQAEKEKLVLEKRLEQAYRENDLLKGRQTTKKLERLEKQIESMYREWSEE